MPTTRNPNRKEQYIRIWIASDEQRDAYPEGATFPRVGRTPWFRYVYDFPMTRRQAKEWLKEVSQNPRGWKYDILRVS